PAPGDDETLRRKIGEVARALVEAGGEPRGAERDVGGEPEPAIGRDRRRQRRAERNRQRALGLVVAERERDLVNADPRGEPAPRRPADLGGGEASPPRRVRSRALQFVPRLVDQAIPERGVADRDAP